MVVKGGHAQKDFWCGQIIVIENSKLGHPTPASRSVRKEHFISNLADGRTCAFRYDKRISCCLGENEADFFM